MLASLTCWQARWGYFLVLGFVMALPQVLSGMGKRWISGALFLIALWPMTVEWKNRFDPARVQLREEQRVDNLCLHDAAINLRSARRLPILAPWWQSPALVYWSGQPCVAGSSHESLPGTVDASRFYLSRDAASATAILKRRRVACIIAYEPNRVLSVASVILGETAGEETMGERLYSRPNRPPLFLKLAYANAAFRVYLVPDGVEP